MPRATWTTFALAAVLGCGQPEPEKTDGPICIDEVPYDGIDQDCDGEDLVDVDLDGAIATEAGGPDCDDTDPDVNPQALDVPYDGIDQDCANGDLVDVDEDDEPAVVAGGLDCNDDDPQVHPGAIDRVGDGTDQNCDGLDGVDQDLDGFASVQSGGPDCDDSDPTRNPAAAEIWYDGVDQNCDRWCDYDQDGDGAVKPGSPVANGSPCDTAPGPEIWAPEDCNDTDPSAASVAMVHSTPTNGATDLSPRLQVTAILSEPDLAAVLSLADPNGVAVPGRLAVDGATLTFSPTDPLGWASRYEATLTHGCGVEVFGFTVEAEPVPVDPTVLIGRVWDLDLPGATWTEPEGILGLFVTDHSQLVEVLDAQGDALDLRLAAGARNVQDLCLPTTDAAGALSPNPVVVVGPVALHSAILGGPLPLLDATLTANITADGSTLIHGVLDALADTRRLGEAIGLGQDPDAVCALVAAFGVACEACPDGRPTCLRVRAEEIRGEDIGGSLVPRTQPEIDADLTCP